MPENDQYPQYRRGRFTGVALLFVLFVAGVLGIVLYRDRDAPASAAGGAPPLDRTITGSTPTNPNILVPPGSGTQSPTPP